VPVTGYCCACYNGEYPVAIPEAFSAGKFLPGYAPRNLSAGRGTQLSLDDEF